MTTACGSIRRQLGAYVDGELSGAERLRVSAHIGCCGACAEEARAVGQLGVLLRQASAEAIPVGHLDGLAEGVVVRLRAEDAQAWPATLRRAADDCRWLLVSTGSVIGTAATALLLAALIAFGPAPVREDSLAALLNNLGRPAGALFLVGSPGDVGEPILMHVAGRGGPPTRAAVQRVADMSPSRPPLALALSNTVVRGGELVELSAMADAERRDAEAQLAAIRRAGLRQAAPLRGGRLSISQVRLVTSTDVKGL